MPPLEEQTIHPTGFLKPEEMPKPQENVSAHSSEIIFRDTYKNLSEFLRPQDTDDANDGTFIVINNTPAIQFADAATRVAYFSFIIPPDLSIISIVFIWSTPATSGNLRWQIDFGEGGDSDTTNVRTTGGTAVSTAADGIANELSFTEVIGAGAGVELSALRKEGLWGIKFTRSGADVADTLTNTVNLYGILIRYR